MKQISKLMIALGALGLAACTNPDQMGGGSGFGNGGGQGGGADALLDPASNPSSPAYFTEVVGDRVLFAVDTSTLTQEGRNTLTAQARWLMTNSEYSAIIEGHADEQGTRDYNLALGTRRANAVREFLVAQGVAGNRLRTVTYGKERPLEICSQESCYAKNRRAVTVISAGAGA
ncbi:MAG: peptidoglycan-associated lipoprotein [Rhodobacterales bacterium]|nr:MAG: peptidoglycan-associated lipoprotein [Rhodobacterales bacterium]